MDIDKHMINIDEMTKKVSTDRRDEWPCNAKAYLKGECLLNGFYGAVYCAECRDPFFGFSGLEMRSCVIKTSYLKRRFAVILSDQQNVSEHSGSFLSNHSDSPPADKLGRLYRRVFFDLYVLNRCRHENVLHSHAVFFTEGDLHLVLPRFYVLQQLIDMYRVKKHNESFSITIIAPIVRQLCSALSYLQKIGIMHRDVQPENVFVTRCGTVKLAHFGQSAPIFDDSAVNNNGFSLNDGCRTPVGKKEFMCYEKLYNLFNSHPVDECVRYSYSADIWSLGVLMLSMITYFPHEKGHKLSENFALFMCDEKMPFIWMISEMVQLRARIVKSGGEELKHFLSDHVLTVSAEKRSTAETLPLTRQMRKWCAPTVEEDKAFLRRKLINEVDFVNRFKLEDGGPNYDCLETKDIPAEFYWSEKWKELELSVFSVGLIYLSSPFKQTEFTFKFSDPEPLFRFLYGEHVAKRIELADILTLDYEIKEMIYETMKEDVDGGNKLVLYKSVMLKRPLAQLNGGRDCTVKVEVRKA